MIPLCHYPIARSVHNFAHCKTAGYVFLAVATIADFGMSRRIALWMFARFRITGSLANMPRYVIQAAISKRAIHRARQRHGGRWLAGLSRVRFGGTHRRQPFFSLIQDIKVDPLYQS